MTFMCFDKKLCVALQVLDLLLTIDVRQIYHIYVMALCTRYQLKSYCMRFIYKYSWILRILWDETVFFLKKLRKIWNGKKSFHVMRNSLKYWYKAHAVKRLVSLFASVHLFQSFAQINFGIYNKPKYRKWYHANSLVGHWIFNI